MRFRVYRIYRQCFQCVGQSHISPSSANSHVTCERVVSMSFLPFNPLSTPHYDAIIGFLCTYCLVYNTNSLIITVNLNECVLWCDVVFFSPLSSDVSCRLLGLYFRTPWFNSNDVRGDNVWEVTTCESESAANPNSKSIRPAASWPAPFPINFANILTGTLA